MIYLFDTFYSNRIDFPKVLKVVAAFATKYCSFYEAEIIVPQKGYSSPTKKSGKIPQDEPATYIGEVIDWLLENSQVNDFFKLFLFNNSIHNTEPMFFDHHDNTSCWALNLTKEQGEDLRTALISNQLPSDLFYESIKAISIKSSGLLGFLGFHKCYTPKEYAHHTNSKLTLKS